MDEEEARRQWD
jgi:STE24 endopeptidase